MSIVIARNLQGWLDQYATLASEALLRGDAECALELLTAAIENRGNGREIRGMAVQVRAAILRAVPMTPQTARFYI